MEITIKPKKSINIDFKELWSFRELFFALVWRDIKVRYKQTAIGVLWAMIQPFIMMVVFSVFFGRIAGIKSGGIPYPIFAFTGLLFWNFFSSSLSEASNSMVGNQAIIQKIYFPRIILPVSGIIVFLVDFVFASIILVGLAIYYGFHPTVIGLVLVVPSLLIAFLTSLGLGLALASINIKYRDVRYVLPFFIQLLLFVTPVIYPSTILKQYTWLWFLNPMAGVIDTMRAGLLGTGAINWQFFGSSFAISIFLLIAGLIIFNRTEKYFADLV